MKSINYQNKYYCSKKVNNTYRVDLKINTIYRKHDNDVPCKYVFRLVYSYGFIIQLEI